MQFYQCITDFIFIEDEPQSADVIFVPGGNYPEAAQHAAELYRKGFAPYILPSGRYSVLEGKFEREGFETECDYLCDILYRGGVPKEAVIREDRATFTYENAIYSRKCIQELGLSVRRAILCCQAFHARRSLMYYQEQLPEVEFLVCPVVTKGISRDTWYRSGQGIDTVLGEMERCGGQFHEIMRKHMEKLEE
ncbi:MAG: YdcF family protein [Lachnospiraceae bacterium]|nr:YdcF family protein [Lachnospiraceae bacterium]